MKRAQHASEIAVTAAEIRACLRGILNDALTNAMHTGEAESFAFMRTHHANLRVRSHISKAVEKRDTCPMFETEMLILAEEAEVPVLAYNTQNGTTLFIFGREVAHPKRGPAPDPKPTPSVSPGAPQLRQPQLRPPR